MANTNFNLVGLDFNTLKDNLKSFLKNNTQFKDLDYEGSNINVLLDVLAYNTYLNGFYTNMVASEMFLDSAQLRDSVISHAKELNYIPRSFTSSKATITVAITPTAAVSSVLIPKYTSFTSRSGSNTYTFNTSSAIALNSSNSGVFSTTVDIHEGVIASETFVVNVSNTAQRYVLSNPTIDTSSLDVTLYEDNGATILTYTRADQLLSIKSSSKAFFLQGAENQQYEIVFGDGVFGRRPKDGSSIVIKYRVSSGELSNGCFEFTSDGAIDGHPSVLATTITSAQGGGVAETTEAIKFNAPRLFQAQNRAVTESDYEVLLLNQFSDIQAISAYGGEKAIPPQYGKVFISVDVADADGAPESRKSAFYDYIIQKTPATIAVEFIDPQFLYVKVNTTVLYDINNTVKTTADIETSVRAAISQYNNDSLANFKKTLYFSNLLEQIDSCDDSIISNDTTIYLVQRYLPQTNVPINFIINVGNQLQTETGLKIEVGEKHYGHTLSTSLFTYQNLSCVLVDDTQGIVYIAEKQSDKIQVIKSVGTIDYINGIVNITNIEIADYEGNYIEFIFETKSKNISGYNNAIIEIDPIDVTVSVQGVKR
jgi:hypothetical protein